MQNTFLSAAEIAPCKSSANRSSDENKMDAMSLSLDEIIKKKGVGKRPAGKIGKGKNSETLPGRARLNRKSAASPTKNGRKKLLGGGGISKPVRSPAAGGLGKPKLVVDARMKIIEKKRSQIRDARDKLVEIARNSGDARLKLLKRKGKPLPGNGILKKSPSKVGKGKPFVDEDDDYDMEVDIRRPIGPLKRTVRNEMFSVPSTMPPLPTFGRSVRPSPPPQTSSSTWNSDPFDCYEVHTSRPILHKPAPAPAPLPNYDDLPPRRTRTRTPPPPPVYVEDRPHLSSTMRARLERAPNPNESMGIFSKMSADDRYPESRTHYHHGAPLSPSPSPPISGHRIVVSNLHSSVTQNDIRVSSSSISRMVIIYLILILPQQELFEDIGDLLESRLVRPGVAEVIYRTAKDAEEAVDTYHNRQLDGLPMKCLLVKPRASNKPTAPAIGYSR